MRILLSVLARGVSARTSMGFLDASSAHSCDAGLAGAFEGECEDAAPTCLYACIIVVLVQ